MKRSFTALFLLVALSLSVAAGEVETPGKVKPPPCDTCSTTSSTNTASTDSTFDAITLTAIQLLLGLAAR